MAKRTRVILLSLDSFLDRAVSPDLTPSLWALAESGGRAPEGGRCQLPSVTYPSHATLLTGHLPRGHGVRTGLAGNPRPGTVPGWAGRANVGIPTLFDAVRAARRRSAAICGDHKLWSILNAAAAHVSWPPDGVVPAGTSVDAFGYATNEAVQPHLLAAAGDRTLAFVFGHYNEPDTWSHILGPDHADTRACYARTDRCVGDVVDVLRDDWARTVVIVVSDHGMELLPDTAPLDLLADDRVRGLIAETVDEAGCSLIRLREGVDPAAAGAALLAIPGVARWTPGNPGDLLVEATSDVVFGRTPPSKSIKAGHGGPATTRTLAIVGGGHPAVPAIAASMTQLPPHLVDWAPTICALLDLDPLATEGRNLATG